MDMQISRFQFESLSPERSSTAFSPLSFSTEEKTSEPEKKASSASPSSSDEATTTAESPAPAPAPTFSEEQLEAAKKSAYDEGFEAGKKQAAEAFDSDSHKIQEETLQVVNIIRRQIPQFDAKQKELLESQKQELGKLVLHCSGRISLEALRQNPIIDIESMIQECLENLLGKSQVVVTAHPKLLTRLNEIFGKEIKLKGDTDLGPGDCLVSWESGQAERRIDDIWHEIETVIDRYFSGKTMNETTADEFEEFATTSEISATEGDKESDASFDDESFEYTSEDETPPQITTNTNTNTGS